MSSGASLILLICGISFFLMHFGTLRGAVVAVGPSPQQAVWSLSLPLPQESYCFW